MRGRRVPNRRGEATRRKLLDCTKELLAASSYRDVKVIDVTRRAGTSPATFYQYFPDLEHAVLVLGDELVQEARAVAELALVDWTGDDGFARALRFVGAFMDFWEQNQSILRVIELSAQEGDQRFRRLRVRVMSPTFDSLNKAIVESRQSGRIPTGIDPESTAAVLVAALGHIAAHCLELESYSISISNQTNALAHLVYWSVTGQTPDSVSSEG